MNYFIIVASLSMFFLFSNDMNAQGGLNQKITGQNFQYEIEAESFSEKKQIRAWFNLHFSEGIPDMSQRRYTLSWRLEDSEGNICFQYSSRASYYASTTDDYQSSSYVRLKIPFVEINAPTGKANYKLIFSAENEIKNLPDFWTTEIELDIKYAVYPFEKQNFELRNVRFVKRMSFDKEELQICFDMHLKYGKDEVKDGKYNFVWELRDSLGKKLLNSIDGQNADWDNEIKLKDFKKKEKGGYTQMECGYVKNKEYVKISGHENMTLRFYIIYNNEYRKIYHEENIKVPQPATLVSLEKQAFKLKDIELVTENVDGIGGIRLWFDCKLKYNKLEENELGRSIYFYLIMKVGDEIIYNPVNMDPSKDKSGYKILSYLDYSHDPVDEYHSMGIFIPYYWLDIKEGRYTIDVSLHATNRYGTFKFGQQAQKSIRLNKPKKMAAHFHLSELSLVPMDHDAELGDNYTNRKPDPQWKIKIGDTQIYDSGVAYNTYSGPTGSVNFIFSKGDKLTLLVYDHDNMFNPNDLLVNLNLSYRDNLLEVDHYKNEYISKLTYRLEVK